MGPHPSRPIAAMTVKLHPSGGGLRLKVTAAGTLKITDSAAVDRVSLVSTRSSFVRRTGGRSSRCWRKSRTLFMVGAVQCLSALDNL